MLISLLIALIVVAVILYAVNIILGMLNVDPRIKQLVWLVIAVIVIIYLLNMFGITHVSGLTAGQPY